ncbi:hypothetical protein VTK73DRAFT_5168 [Phialemonium thermophilum]|uniref:Pyridoxamine 5'-phosphate oxidase N-terminal domain-containing protein n=1 Tax=Phialemonium thermophilum TaxID=223376 RepID=A0ABR3XYW4_9PEZI
MGVFYEAIPDSLRDWIQKQKMFWVATAPLSGSGHVNVSPKGGDYFGVLDARTFWYLELTGSGSETIAHLYEPGNARITVMMSAFEGPPRILRLFGTGQVLENGTQEFESFVSRHGVRLIPGTRSVIIVHIHQVGTSCGFSVPYYDFKAHRPILVDHFKKKEEKYLAGNENERIDRYWAAKNAWSMDGLPAMKKGLETAKRENIEPIKKMVGPLAPEKGHDGVSGSYLATQTMWLVAVVSFLLGVLSAYMPKGSLTLEALKTTFKFL